MGLVANISSPRDRRPAPTAATTGGFIAISGASSPSSRRPKNGIYPVGYSTPDAVGSKTVTNTSDRVRLTASTIEIPLLFPNIRSFPQPFPHIPPVLWISGEPDRRRYGLTGRPKRPFPMKNQPVSNLSTEFSTALSVVIHRFSQPVENSASDCGKGVENDPTGRAHPDLRTRRS